MNKIIITIIALKSFAAISQVPVYNFTPKEKLYMQTLQGAVIYLKNNTTKYFDFHQTETYSNDEAFYDTVITRFFNKEKMLKNFEKNTDVFAVEGKVDIVRHVLNGCDYYLDFIPADSIFIRPMRYKIKNVSAKEDSIEMSNALEIFFKVEGKEITMMGCAFDNETGKFLNLILMGTSDLGENNSLIKFLQRQKNYYEYPIKRHQ